MELYPSLFVPILPQILLLVLGAIVLFLDIWLPREKQRLLGWVTATGMGIIMLIMIPGVPAPVSQPIWGGMVRWDWMSYTFSLLFLFGAAVTALLGMDYQGLGDRGEFYVLLIAATIGMMFMASAADLIMVYLAFESVSIPMYVLAGFLVRSEGSTESGFKYMLFGALSSAIMLYGFSLIYGFAGMTNLQYIGFFLKEGNISLAFVLGSLMLVLVGVGFKISAVPFHFWAPDTYQGAPTPVVGFLSTASKAAGFVVLLRLLIAVFGTHINLILLWSPVLAAISVATMTLGNLIALTQHNIKRMLAYSSIAHAGYALIGIVAASGLGLISVIYYLGAYLITNLAAFGIVSIYSSIVGSDDMKAYYGMSRRSPGLALAMLVAFLSLAGMPPFAGFVAKVFVFAAAVQSNLIWLAVVGVLNSIVGLYYYLTVLKYVYLYRSEGDEQSIAIPRSATFAMAVLVIGILLVGTVLSPWFTWASTAAASMF